MQAPLHEDAGPAQVYSLLNLLQNLLDAQNVAVAFLGLPLSTVESTERAGHPADVRVVDVPVDDVRDDVARMEPAADLIRRRRELQKVPVEEPGKLPFGLP